MLQKLTLIRWLLALQPILSLCSNDIDIDVGAGSSLFVSLLQAFRFILVSRTSPLVSSMDDIEADTLLTDELTKPLSEDNVVMKGLTREAARAAALLKGGNGFATPACHTPSAREGIWGQALQKAVWNILCDVRHDAVIALTTRQMQGIVRRA